MKLFINDIPVFIRKISGKINIPEYNVILAGGPEDLSSQKMIDDVLIWNASEEHVDELLKLMTNKKFKDLDSVTFAVEKKKKTMAYLKDKFRVIEAGGGVVEKNGQILLIYRRKRWDLPKGKLDKDESPTVGAVREVQEECNVQVEIGDKICHTWHTYISNGKYVMKKTHWYAMLCKEDSFMKPQVEEDIEDVRWMTVSESREALYNSYRSIRHVVQQYYKIKNRLLG